MQNVRKGAKLFIWGKKERHEKGKMRHKDSKNGKIGVYCSASSSQLEKIRSFWSQKGKTRSTVEKRPSKPNARKSARIFRLSSSILSHLFLTWFLLPAKKLLCSRAAKSQLISFLRSWAASTLSHCVLRRCFQNCIRIATDRCSALKQTNLHLLSYLRFFSAHNFYNYLQFNP